MAEWGQIRVLLVAPKPVVRSGIEQLIRLRELPYDLQVVASQREAAARLPELCPGVVLLDCTDVNGSQRRILDDLGGVPLICLVSDGTEAAAPASIREDKCWHLLDLHSECGLSMLPATIEQIVRCNRRLAQVQESEARFRLMADTAPVMLWMSDAGGRCTFFSKPWLDFRGRTLQEEEGHGWTEGVHPEDREERLRTHFTALESRPEFRTEYRVRRHDGQYRWILDHGMPRHLADGRFVGYIGSAIDITEHREAQQLLRQAHDELEQRVDQRTAELRAANRRLQREMDQRIAAEEQVQRHLAEMAHMARLSTMGEMVSGLAHELNQPLSAIANYARASLYRMRSAGAGRLEPGDLEEVADALEQIAGQTDRAGQIIRHLRGFVRRADAEHAAVDINHLVRDIAVLLEVDARVHGARLRLRLDDSLPAVVADRVQIEQVIANLVRNAMEAMDEVPPGGREVTILTTCTAYRCVEVAVRDQGTGMQSEDVHRWFEPFYTTKPNGMGLGLSISRSIVEAHGGRLEALPNPQGGSIFRFRLPIGGQGDAT